MTTETKSEAPRSLAQKLAACMALIDKVEKRGFNSFHHYHYATADDVMEAVQKVLAAQGVMIFPCVTDCSRRDVQTKNGVQSVVTVKLVFRVTDGETTYEVPFVGEGSDTGDKAIQKAITSAHKFFLTRMLNINTGDSGSEKAEQGGPIDTEHDSNEAVLAEASRVGSRTERVKAKVKAQTAAAANTSGELTAPFGKQKGQPISHLTNDNLEWLTDTIERAAEDPERAKFRDSNLRLLVALKAEAARRGQPELGSETDG